MKSEKRTKKAAFELSMSTIVIIVLSVVFLILGLVLLRTIFGVATTSVSDLDNKLKSEMTKIFADEDTSSVFIRPENGEIKVRAGTTNFGFIVGARTANGNTIGNWPEMQYRLVLDENSDCYKKLKPEIVKKWFAGINIASSDLDTQTYNNINWAKQDDVGLARIQLTIPKGTILCTQTVRFDFIDKTNPGEIIPLDGGAFSIEILRKSIV